MNRKETERKQSWNSPETDLKQSWNISETFLKHFWKKVLLLTNQRASFTISDLFQKCFRTVSDLFLFPFCFLSASFLFHFNCTRAFNETLPQITFNEESIDAIRIFPCCLVARYWIHASLSCCAALRHSQASLPAEAVLVANPRVCNLRVRYSRVYGSWVMCGYSVVMLHWTITPKVRGSNPGRGRIEEICRTPWSVGVQLVTQLWARKQPEATLTAVLCRLGNSHALRCVRMMNDTLTLNLHVRRGLEGIKCRYAAIEIVVYYMEHEYLSTLSRWSGAITSGPFPWPVWRQNPSNMPVPVETWNTGML